MQETCTCDLLRDKRDTEIEGTGQKRRLVIVIGSVNTDL